MLDEGLRRQGEGARLLRAQDQSEELSALRAGAALCVAASLPFLFGAGSGAMNDMVLAAAYVVMALGLNVVVGFAGLLDLGYVAFYAIGAHVAAYFSSPYWSNAGGGHGISLLVGGPVASTHGIHFNFLIVLLLAVVATTIAGVLIGLPTLRVRGDYVGVITLAFGEIIGQLADNGRQIALFGGSLTAGSAGISPIDEIDLPFVGRFGVDPRPWYWFALALVALMLFVNYRLRDSRVGRAWIALRDDEDVAAGSGIPIVRTKLLAYAVGAALGGVSGAFLASYLGYVQPGEFTFSFSLLILAMVVLGGLGSIRGVVLGAILLSVLNTSVLPKFVSDVPIGPGVFGAIVVIVMVVRPQGLLPSSGAA